MAYTLLKCISVPSINTIVNTRQETGSPLRPPLTFTKAKAKMCWKICASVLVLFPVFSPAFPAFPKVHEARKASVELRSKVCKTAREILSVYLGPLLKTPHSQSVHFGPEFTLAFLSGQRLGLAFWTCVKAVDSERRAVCKLAGAAARNSRK